MFEESLVESQIAQVSVTKRWTMVGSTALQASLAVTLIALPLFHPERLVLHLQAPLVFTPPPPRPPLPVVQEQQASQQAAASSAPSLPLLNRPLAPSFLHPSTRGEDAPPTIRTGSLGLGNGLPDVFATPGGHGTAAVNVAPSSASAKPMRVSEGITAGLLLTPIRPTYPAIARAAGISGTVVIEAIISKTGSIESLHVVSGPAMLRGAALDAIRTARYRPFQLNHEPTEVQTTITVNFRMGS